MDVYSTVWPSEDIKISTFYQDIVKFRKSVTLKRYSMAFITGPMFEDYYDCTSDEEGMEEFRKEEDEFYTVDYDKCIAYHFKKLFPNVPFLSTFREHIFKSYGIDLMNGKRKDSLNTEYLKWYNVCNNFVLQFILQIPIKHLIMRRLCLL